MKACRASHTIGPKIKSAKMAIKALMAKRPRFNLFIYSLPLSRALFTFDHTYEIAIPDAIKKTIKAITRDCCGRLYEPKKFEISTPSIVG